MPLKVGDTREQVVIEKINRTHIVKYAGASGDFNPIHHDEVFAKEVAGYPSVFAHGMLSMGLTGRALTDWLGVMALKRYGVRFTRQVWPGDTLTAKFEVTKVEDGLATIKVVTVNQNGETVIEGEAVAKADAV
ncbi:MAG: MaoC family dehydratase N-terminal domain-containing protein [Dehalococcoidia bacterium]|jgi:acyl dehydratase|uniref:Acyl dehydratase n=1 Tax=Tepidiforma bonchosmolovskayae TaxID=2601677 RepID=A0ABX6C391_9CHLR|nr:MULTISPECIES: MaoC/PaaZ C-terminal domain-containing protein [Tepidiforma]MCL6643735.1 MaoC family dehydratase N-terminal domain-containing protein [Dehalococcoidia bacterium]QFG03747.1 acyl dehydratase [Tepidiforma bonchosmolovskayae]GIW15012.1 MAG: MaoC-like dehydratase [Tepidiforma sp.]